MPVDVIATIKAANAIKGVGEGAVKAGKWATASPLDASIRDGFEQVNREMTQVCFAVVRALVAHQLGRETNNEEVGAVHEAAIGDPTWPARAYRLFGEGKKSPSKRRRHFLAAVLFGLPFTTMSSDDRDRVDMLAERLVPEDIELLGRIAAIETQDERRFILYAHLDDVKDVVKIVGVREGNRNAFVSFVPSGPAFKTLESQGCLYRSTGFSSEVTIDGDSATGIHVEITPLGRLLLKALADIRAGLDVVTA